MDIMAALPLEISVMIMETYLSPSDRHNFKQTSKTGMLLYDCLSIAKQRADYLYWLKISFEIRSEMKAEYERLRETDRKRMLEEYNGRMAAIMDIAAGRFTPYRK
jgi:hypothetical protein